MTTDTWLQDQWRAAENEVVARLSTHGAVKRPTKSLPMPIRQLLSFILTMGQRCPHALSTKSPVPWIIDTSELTITCLNCVNDKLVLEELDGELDFIDEFYPHNEEPKERNVADRIPTFSCDICRHTEDVSVAVIGIGITVAVIQLCRPCYEEWEDRSD